MVRHLATIRRIEEIKSIPEADLIQAYRVCGWWVVDGVGKYKVGDLVCYVEPDAWMPNSLASFLSKGQEPREYNGVLGERLRTIRLRGQLSQGLLLPITDDLRKEFAFSFRGFEGARDLTEGDDITELLGIQKYDPPVPANLAGIVKSSWPSQIPHTDEERIQNLTNDWSNLRELTYEVSEKIEGSSMTVGRIDGEFIVCSRNLNLLETEGNSFWAQARRYDIEAKMIERNLDNLVIQCEIYGEGIQGGYYQIKGHDIMVYAIYDIQTGEFVDPKVRRQLCDDIGLKHVPIIHEAFRFSPTATVAEALVMSDNKSHINPTKLREGLVYKQVGGQTHFKIVSDEYLLKTEKNR